MRTTIDMTDEHRAALLDLAARRKLKGFSELVAEAIDGYLEAQARRDERLQRALKTRGALDEAESNDLQAGVHAARATWRS